MFHRLFVWKSVSLMAWKFCRIFFVASRVLIQPISADIGNDLIYMDIRRPSMLNSLVLSFHSTH